MLRYWSAIEELQRLAHDSKLDLEVRRQLLDIAAAINEAAIQCLTSKTDCPIRRGADRRQKPRGTDPPAHG
jgi:hypothetical protein